MPFINCIICGKPRSDKIEVCPFCKPESKPEPTSAHTTIAALIGIGILVVGSFAPVIQIPIVGALTYVNNGQGDGVVVLTLAAIALVTALLKMVRIPAYSGLISLLIILYGYFTTVDRIAGAKATAQASLQGNPFAALGEMASQSLQLQWGWGLLFVGSILLTISPLIAKAIKTQP